MRTTLCSSLPAVLSLALAACAPAANGTTPPKASPAIAADPPVPQAPDLSPVSEPPDVVLVARARNLRDTLSSAERMVRLPVSLENEIRKLLRDNDLDAFNLDAGLDLVITLDPESADDDPRFVSAFSLPVKDLERARAVFEREGRVLTPLIPGVYRSKVLDRTEQLEALEDAGDEEDGFDIEKRAPKETYCDLSVSVGRAPARVVCAQRTEELDELRPWLTRGLPTVPLGEDDVFAEIRFEPFRDRYVPVLRAQLPGIEFLAKRWLESELDIRDPRLLALPRQIMDEGLAFANDLDRISVSARLDADASEIRLKSKIAFRDRSAWLTRVYTDTNDEAGPPPASFWRLPRDADSATYARSADPELYEDFHQTLGLLVANLLTKTPLSAPARSSINAFIADAPMHKATVVSARGAVAFDGKAIASKNERPTARDALREVEKLVNTAVGWSVVGIDAPSASYVDWFKKGVTAYNRLLRDARAHKDFAKDMKDATWIPEVRVRNYLAGYPRGSMGVDVTVRFDSKEIWDFTTGAKDQAPEHPEGPAARGAITLKLVVVPDGANRTWIGMSADEKTLKQKMSVVLDADARDATIASMSGVDSLRTTPTVAAGFVTYGNLLTHTADTLKSSSEVDPEAVKKIVEALPNRLRTPILLLHTATTGHAPVHEFEVRVQRGSVEDIASLVHFALSPEGRGIIDKLDDAP